MQPITQATVEVSSSSSSSSSSSVSPTHTDRRIQEVAQDTIQTPSSLANNHISEQQRAITPSPSFLQSIWREILSKIRRILYVVGIISEEQCLRYEIQLRRDNLRGFLDWALKNATLSEIIEIITIGHLAADPEYKMFLHLMTTEECLAIFGDFNTKRYARIVFCEGSGTMISIDQFHEINESPLLQSLLTEYSKNAHVSAEIMFCRQFAALAKQVASTSSDEQKMQLIVQFEQDLLQQHHITLQTEDSHTGSFISSSRSTIALNTTYTALARYQQAKADQSVPSTIYALEAIFRPISQDIRANLTTALRATNPCR